MKTYKVNVTGELDWQYEIEADDECEAEAEAEERFQDEFHTVQWSGVNTWDPEEIE